MASEAKNVERLWPNYAIGQKSKYVMSPGRPLRGARVVFQDSLNHAPEPGGQVYNRPSPGTVGLASQWMLSDPWKQFCQQRRGNGDDVVVGGNCDITDVRVIHPLVSKDNIQRKHAETNKVHVPANNRAPTFQCIMRDMGPPKQFRRPPVEPPMRLGGRVGGEGCSGVKAKRWRGASGQPNWSAISAADEASPAVLQRLHAKNAL